MNEELRHEICMKLMTFDCMMRDHKNKDMESFGITGRQADVLFYLLNHKDTEIRQVMIEREFRLSNPTVTGIINRMEQNGFVKRVPSEYDRRCNCIQVTGKTERLCEEIQKKGQKMEKKLFEGIDDRDAEVLQKSMELLYRNLEKMRTEQEKQ